MAHFGGHQGCDASATMLLPKTLLLLVLALFCPQLDRIIIIHTTKSLEIESIKCCQLPIRSRLLHSRVELQEAIRFVGAVKLAQILRKCHSYTRLFGIDVVRLDT
jgi:hypothetical protein